MQASPASLVSAELPLLRLSPEAYHAELILRCLVFSALENTICVRGIDMLIHTSNSLAYEQIQLNCFITAGKKTLLAPLPREPPPPSPAECQSCLDTQPDCTHLLSKWCWCVRELIKKNVFDRLRRTAGQK